MNSIYEYRKEDGKVSYAKIQELRTGDAATYARTVKFTLSNIALAESRDDYNLRIYKIGACKSGYHLVDGICHEDSSALLIIGIILGVIALIVVGVIVFKKCKRKPSQEELLPSLLDLSLIHI